MGSQVGCELHQELQRRGGGGIVRRVKSGGLRAIIKEV